MKLSQIVRLLDLLGSIAMFWCNWWVAVLLFIFHMFVMDEDYKGPALIKNTRLRYTIEYVGPPISVYGVWAFPFLDKTITHILAVIGWSIIALYLSEQFRKHKKW